MAPRTKIQFEEIRLNKRALIIRSALEMFAMHGFHGTSITRIAERSQISKGLLYNYFESKELLLKEIIDQGLNTISKLMDPDQDGIITTGEMKNMIDEMFHILTEHKVFWMLYFSVLTQPDVMLITGDRVKEFFAKTIHMLQVYFMVRGSEDPVADAFLFGALLDGISFNYILSDRDYPLEKVRTQVIKLFLK